MVSREINNPTFFSRCSGGVQMTHFGQISTSVSKPLSNIQLAVDVLWQRSIYSPRNSDSSLSLILRGLCHASVTVQDEKKSSSGLTGLNYHCGCGSPVICTPPHNEQWEVGELGLAYSGAMAMIEGRVVVTGSTFFAV